MAMKLLRRSPIERIIRRLERHPAVVVTTATLSFRMSKDYARVRAGEIDRAEFGRRGVTHVGSISGGMMGAAAGAAAGTLLAPGLGTMLGAFSGSVVGDEFGTRLGRAAVEHAEVRLQSRPAENETEPESEPMEETAPSAAEGRTPERSDDGWGLRRRSL